MAEDYIPVAGTSDNLETISYINGSAVEVHREGVFIGDGSNGSNKATVNAYGALQVSLSDGPFIDAFDRLRVSNPTTVFDSKQIHNDGALFWDDVEVSGGSTGSTWSQAGASTTLSVGATTAGRRVRQTYRRFNYQPGKSQLILVTGTLGASATGIVRCMGLYDDGNGFFLRDNAGTYQFVRRSSAGSPITDTAVDQSSWNIDPFDGTGPSGVTLDFSQAQILVLDYEWLGVGRARCGFVVDGIIYYGHQFLHANTAAGVYMSTPNLPVRYEIENDGTGAASSLECICSSVMSEGGTQDVGTSRYHSSGSTPIQANTSGTVYAVCGIRLKAANVDGVIKLSNLSVMCETADSFEWLLIFNPTIAGSPQPAWTSLASSVIETSVGEASDPSASTVTGGTQVAGGHVKSSNSTGDISSALDTALQLGSAIDGTVDELWLCVRPLGANADVYGSLSWKEIS